MNEGRKKRGKHSLTQLKKKKNDVVTLCIETVSVTPASVFFTVPPFTFKHTHTHLQPHVHIHTHTHRGGMWRTGVSTDVF